MLRTLMFLSFLIFCHSAFSSNDKLIGKKLALEHFAKLPAISNPVISPYGNKMAAEMVINGEKTLVMMDYELNDSVKIKNLVPIRSGDKHFNWYRWANEDRLIMNIRTTVKHRRHQYTVTRLASVSSDGKDLFLFKMNANDGGYFRQFVNVYNWLDKDKKHIMVGLDNSESAEVPFPLVHKVDVYTGKKTKVQGDTRGILNWVVDNDGDVRVGASYPKLSRKNTEVKIHYRENRKSKWQILQKTQLLDNAAWFPVRFHETQKNILLVTSDELVEENEDNKKLFEYDLNSQRILGPYVNTKRKAVRDLLKKAVPDRKSRIVSTNQDETRFVIKIHSDDASTQYFIYDSMAKKFLLIGSEHPGLVGQALSKMEKVNYEARDGFVIPAFLSLPVGTDRKNLPTVIFPHGGPWAHDRWGFNRYVQFLTNRGYAVLQPQFRGSTGYGIEHEEAGYEQWGLAIQDDITDGTKWLIDEGISDPKRICIMGGSFGGYAAAFALVKTPELFKCAISSNGVMDLPRHIKDNNRYLFSGINKAITNKKKDSKLLSPYHQAKSIQAPLLLMHGDKDSVVPYSDSKRMAKRLKKYKKPHDFITLSGGEHWRSNEKNELIKFKAMEAFLAEYLSN